MNFRIADTFTASLARLTPQEQKAAETTAIVSRNSDGFTSLSRLRPARVTAKGIGHLGDEIKKAFEVD